MSMLKISREQNFFFVCSYLRSIEGDLNDRNKPPKTKLLRLSQTTRCSRLFSCRFSFIFPRTLRLRYNDSCIARDIIIQNSQMKREIVCTIRRWASLAHREKMEEKLGRENRGNNIIAGYQTEMDISLSLLESSAYYSVSVEIKIIDRLSGLYSHLIRP